HVDAAELGDDVRAGGELADRLAPLRVDVLRAARVGTDAERPAEMVKDDRRARERARQRGDVRDLMMVEPRLEPELARRQVGESLAEVVAQEQALSGPGPVTGHRVVRVPGSAQPNSAKPAPARGDLRVEHSSYAVAEPEGGGPDDAGGDARLAVEPGGAHGGDPVHELGLADGPQGLGPVALEHRAALDEQIGRAH